MRVHVHIIIGNNNIMYIAPRICHRYDIILYYYVGTYTTANVYNFCLLLRLVYYFSPTPPYTACYIPAATTGHRPQTEYKTISVWSTYIYV